MHVEDESLNITLSYPQIVHDFESLSAIEIQDGLFGWVSGESVVSLFPYFKKHVTIFGGKARKCTCIEVRQFILQ
jgi:hypothetical protein